MAHFAQIDDKGKVAQVIAVSNCVLGSCIGKDHWDYQEEYHADHTGNVDFPESEAMGQKHLADCGFEGTWLQTSYNGKFRGRYANSGMIYDKSKDEFVLPDPVE
jgi:hypothetical protein